MSCLQQILVLEEYPDVMTKEIYESQEYEEIPSDSIEALDNIERVYADLFDIEMITERGKTPEMDTLDYIYWELKERSW